MSVCFPINAELGQLVYARLMQLGYKENTHIRDRVNTIHYIRVDEEILHCGIARYPDSIAGTPWSWGSLNDLFFTERYRIKKPIVLGIGIGEVTVSDHVAFGCKKVTLEEVERIVTAIAEYKKG